MGDASGSSRRSLEIESYLFFKMHEVPCDYETTDCADVMPLDEVRGGLKHLNMRISTFYDRPPPSLPSAGGNTAFANGTGAASFVKQGQIMTPIKLLKRFGQDGLESPVFFYAYQNYEKKLAKMQEEIHEECMVVKRDPEYKVNNLLRVTLGGLFILKSKFGEQFIRVRVTKILLDKLSVQYWAVDEAFFGECDPSDLLFINQRLADMNMLAVPGVFETDPKPTQLVKLEGDSHPYCMARLAQPRYSNDFGPRKVSLM